MTLDQQMEARWATLLGLQPRRRCSSCGNVLDADSKRQRHCSFRCRQISIERQKSRQATRRAQRGLLPFE